MEQDVMSDDERDAYEGYVLQSLQDALFRKLGIDAYTRLDELDEDILEEATEDLRDDFDVSFRQNSNMTISELAEALWTAVKSR
ncbi:hypothetical protein IAE39_000799 [Pseudomonas sp. S37]|uniref:hypothetical protein n=1 Tax=Pseudomonas sp. S37 TaxID=2767449 RepID=UPI001913A0FA|nr:hypothetical protein [Pseudomonas sp. S37]MBK4992625.1 hypothetical protein [Pseudomonas sp. S37]